MASDSENMDQLLQRALEGDQHALADLFAAYSDRLRRMVHLRLDRRLQGRVDPSDVLQEAYLVLARRFPEYAGNPVMPFFLWLRTLTGQKLIEFHRQHLGARRRDAGREVPLASDGLPAAASESLAQQLLGRLTSASRAAIRAETQRRVQEALNNMAPMDREILTLRHFEMLTTDETAAVLGIKRSTAGNRYIRALKRLKEILADEPDLGDEASP
jgi:RNA polymerase sigma-70 factor (ECF subfamily)